MRKQNAAHNELSIKYFIDPFAIHTVGLVSVCYCCVHNVGLLCVCICCLWQPLFCNHAPKVPKRKETERRCNREPNIVCMWIDPFVKARQNIVYGQSIHRYYHCCIMHYTLSYRSFHSAHGACMLILKQCCPLGLLDTKLNFFLRPLDLGMGLAYVHILFFFGWNEWV